MALSANKSLTQQGTGPMPAKLSLPVYTGTTIYKGSIVCINTAHGYAVVGSTATTLIPFGIAEDYVYNSSSSGAKDVNVIPGVFKFANSTGDAITAAMVGQKCYIEDDATACGTSTGKSQLGTVISVETDGVFVCVGPYPVPDTATYVTLTGTQTLTNKTLTTPTVASLANATHTHANAAGGGLLSAAAVTPGSVAHRKLRVNAAANATELGGDVMIAGAALTFTGTDCAVTVTESGTHYIITTPGSAAPQTLSLQTTNAARGWYVVFTANGTANTETIQYRSVTTNITSALSASKAHQVKCVFDGTAWSAQAYVSP
jgi:hypothetical protein